MKSKVVMLVLLSLVLNACVEIKDPNELENEPAPKAEVAVVYNNLYVEKVAYLWDGNVLTEEEYLKTKPLTLSAENPSTYKFDNLEIAEGAVIYTLGQKLKIEITNLISKGRIETFPAGIETSAGASGRSGGHIEIYIQNPVGFLDFVMRGLNGGRGRDGARGADGVPGAHLTHCFANQNEINSTFGGKGQPGGDGNPGGNGGNSGMLNLHIPATRDFVYTIKKIPGEFGAGGKGNEGGNQGAQGTGCIGKVLKPVPLDPNLKGKRGIDAKDGIPGLVERACVFTNGQPACG